MKFKELLDGEKFRFSNPAEFSIGKVFRKTSPRGYRIVGDKSILGGDYKVGTINVEILREGKAVQS